MKVLSLGERAVTGGANDVSDAINGGETTVSLLKEKEFKLLTELKQQIIKGNAAEVIRLQTALRELPASIAAAEIAELRIGIDNSSARLEELKDDIEYLEGVRAHKNKVLAVLIEQQEDAAFDVRKVDLALYQMDNEAESLRETKRELTERLNTFAANAHIQIGEKIT